MSNVSVKEGMFSQGSDKRVLAYGFRGIDLSVLERVRINKTPACILK